MQAARLRRGPRSTPGKTWRVRLKLLQACRIELADIGMTPTQACVLLYVQRYPGTYQRRVADTFGMDAGSIGMVLRIAQGKGWVRRQRDPEDDRCVLITLTPKGTALVRQIRQRLAPAPWLDGQNSVGSVK